MKLYNLDDSELSEQSRSRDLQDNFLYILLREHAGALPVSTLSRLHSGSYVDRDRGAARAATIATIKRCVSYGNISTANGAATLLCPDWLAKPVQAPKPAPAKPVEWPERQYYEDERDNEHLYEQDTDDSEPVTGPLVQSVADLMAKRKK